MKKTFLSLSLVVLAVIAWKVGEGHKPSESPAAIARRGASGSASASAPVLDSRMDGNPVRSPLARAVRQVRAESALSYADYMKNHVRAMLDSANPPLNLSEEEYASCARVVIEMFKVNGLIKAQAARVVVAADGTVVVTVPARPPVAAEMQRMLQEQLATRLGGARGGEIYLAVQDGMTSFFWGFGAADERYEFTPRGEAGICDFDFCAVLLPDARSPDVVALLKHWGGGSQSGTNADVRDLVSDPRFSFLAGLIHD